MEALSTYVCLVSARGWGQGGGAPSLLYADCDHLMTRTLFRSLVLALTISALCAGAAFAQSPPPMPPGMTPEIMKMMMTPGAPNPPGLPPGLTPQSGCIPTMGFHYAKGSDFPFGPIYGYYEGKAIFTEYMPTVEQFTSGFNTDDIKPLPGYTIDHVDIWYEPHGHPGLTVPHYDIHAWYIPHTQHMTFCNNSSGKRPPFL